MRMKVRKSITLTMPDKTKEKLREMSDYCQIPMSTCMENLVDLLYPDWEYFIERQKILGQDYIHYLIERDRIDPLRIKVQLMMGQEGTPIVVSDPKRLPVNKKTLPAATDVEADVFTQPEPPKEVKPPVIKDEKTTEMDNRLADMQKQIEALQKERSEYEQQKQLDEMEEQVKTEYAKRFVNKVKNTAKDNASNTAKDNSKGANIKKGNFMC